MKQVLTYYLLHIIPFIIINIGYLYTLYKLKWRIEKIDRYTERSIFYIYAAFSCFTFNKLIQVFCQPIISIGIIIILTIFSISIVQPFFKKNKITDIFNGFFQGICILGCIYLIIIWHEAFLYALITVPFYAIISILIFLPYRKHFKKNVYSILFISVSIYLPIFLLFQAIYNFTKSNLLWRFSCTTSIIILSIKMFIFYTQYSQIYNTLNTIEISEKNIPQIQKIISKNEVSERILGMHFKYHTEFEEYDGCRPPLHDPFLVVSYHLNGKKDILKNIDVGNDLSNRIKLYKEIFPEENIITSCTCALSCSKEEYWSKAFFKNNGISN